MVLSNSDGDLNEIQRLLRSAVREVAFVAGSGDDYANVVDDVLTGLDEQLGAAITPEATTIKLDGLIEVANTELTAARNAMANEADGLSDPLDQIQRMVNRIPRSSRADTSQTPLAAITQPVKR